MVAKSSPSVKQTKPLDALKIKQPNRPSAQKRCIQVATLPNKLQQRSQLLFQSRAFKKQTQILTRITVCIDVGFSNELYLRGEGAGLSWDKGVPLKNIKSDVWYWESKEHFGECFFKVLINDEIYEKGLNHKIKSGMTKEYFPHF